MNNCDATSSGALVDPRAELFPAPAESQSRMSPSPQRRTPSSCGFQLHTPPSPRSSASSRAICVAESENSNTSALVAMRAGVSDLGRGTVAGGGAGQRGPHGVGRREWRDLPKPCWRDHRIKTWAQDLPVCSKKPTSQARMSASVQVQRDVSFGCEDECTSSAIAVRMVSSERSPRTSGQ